MTNLHNINQRYETALNTHPAKGTPTRNAYLALADSVADIPTLMAEIEHLQAQIRRVKAITTGNNRHIYGNDFEAGMAKALWLVHQILGKDRDE